MKKLIIAVLLVAMCLALCACGKAAPPAAPATDTQPQKTEEPAKEPAPATASEPEEKNVTLKFSYPQAEASYYGTTYGHFAQLVNEKTNGTVTIEMYPAASLVGDADILDAVSMGNVDMGHFYTTYMSPTIPDLIPLEVPGAYPAEDYDALNAATFDIVDSILNDYNCKFIAMSYPDVIAIASTKGIIHGASDLAGLSIRSGGTYITKAMQLWNGAGATIPIGDVAFSLERGSVDGVYTGWMMVDSFKFYESAPYVTFTPFQNTYYGIMINMDQWNSLSENQQNAMIEAGKEFGQYSSELYFSNKEAFLAKMKDTDAEIYFMSEEEGTEMVNSALTLMDEVSGMMTEKGTALIDALASLRG